MYGLILFELFTGKPISSAKMVALYKKLFGENEVKEKDEEKEEKKAEEKVKEDEKAKEKVRFEATTREIEDKERRDGVRTPIGLRRSQSVESGKDRDKDNYGSDKEGTKKRKSKKIKTRRGHITSEGIYYSRAA